MRLDHAFVHCGEAPDDALEGRGKGVDASDDQHVVHPAQDAAREPEEGPTARAWPRGRTHPVTGAVAQQRRAGPAEVREHQLTLASGHAGHRIQDLGDELALVDVRPRLSRALEAIGAHLGHSRMVVRLGAPGLLDAGAHHRNPGSRLARVHRGPDAELSELQAALARDLGEVQRIGGRAADRRGAQRLDGGQALGGVLAAAGDGETAEGARALEARPEADEEAEREREEHAVPGAEPRAPQDEAPAARPPVPRLLRIEPAERRAGGARGLVHAHVARDGKRQVAPEWWKRRLVVDQLGLHRQRQAEEVVPAPEVVGRPDPRAPPLARDERVGGNDGARQAPEARPLMRPERLGVQCLQTPIIERRHARSLKRWIFPVAVFGSSATNSIHRGYLYGAILSFTKLFSSASSADEPDCPSLSTTKALGFTSLSVSSHPTTAASSTAGCPTRVFSTSTGDTQMPPTLSMSSARPQYQKNPSASW